MFQMFVRMLLFFSDTDDIPPQRKSKTFWCCAVRIYQLFKNNLRKLNICYLSGEMHDIFVGLMGRRSADPGNRLSLSLLTFDKNSFRHRRNVGVGHVPTTFCQVRYCLHHFFKHLAARM